MIRKLNFCILLMCYASFVIAQKPVDLLWKHQNVHRDTTRTNIGFKTARHHLNNPVAYQKKVSLIESAEAAPAKIIYTNDQTILGLNNLSAIQTSLKEISLQRNITLIGFLINFILAGLLCLACRSRRRSNFSLKLKQEEINTQNNSLSFLLSEKEKLLKDKDELLNLFQDLVTEKEWLLREVNHRVKNNLQIVMSLLYIQSAYLQNTDAIEAISDSRNRVQAMSIIHQKLYNKNNVATIIMADYINDLVRYLYTFYDCKRLKIKFKEELDQVNLDISQAVPMGLILNEAITNCIKYAFDKDGGDILIKARVSDSEIIVLSIADNGRGLPGNFNLAETSSLGMEMMKVLSKQLGGNFEIKNDPGVVVTVKFKIEN